MHKFVLLLLLSSCLAAPLQLDFPAVGQGSAIILHDAKDTVLLDTGPASAVKNIFRVLSKTQTKGISAIFISHPHDDHYGGATALLKKYPVEKLYISALPSAEQGYQHLLAVAAQKKIPVTILSHTEIVSFNNFYVRTLQRTAPNLPSNEASLVLAVYTTKGPLLLACADIGPSTQQKLLPLLGQQKFPVITAPHHGAEKPSPAWLKLAQEAIIIVQAGASKYKYPRPEFLQAIQGLRVYRTDLLGSLIIGANKGAYYVRSAD